MTSKWRDVAAPIIARVLRETQGRDDAEIRRALRDAYPFGERAMHPYKIWLDEVKRQRGVPANARPDEHARARELFVAAGKPIPAWLGES